MLKVLVLLLGVFPNSYFLNQLVIKAIFLNPCAGDPATIGKLIGQSILRELRILPTKDIEIGSPQYPAILSRKSLDRHS